MERGSIVRETLGLLVLTVAAGTIANVSASPVRALKWLGSMPAVKPPVSLPVATPATPAVDVAASESPAAPGSPVEIDTARAVAEHQAGAVFLDARRSEIYQQGRIPGARAFAVWEMDVDDKVLTLMSELPPGTRIITYCTGGKCEDSHLLREKLLAAGYGDVLVYHDGMPGWEQAGQPVER